MPFASEAQRRFMHANHPEIAERWEHEMKDKGYDPYGNNARNTPSEDTYRELMEQSATPFVSATPGFEDGRGIGETGDACLSTMGTAVHVYEDGSVHTRFKYGPADSGGAVSLPGV